MGGLEKSDEATQPKDTKPLTPQQEYEQRERQRKSPHLYTTLTQCVNADGSITTFEGVTRKCRESLEKLQEYHRQKYGGRHPDYCMKGMEYDGCKAIEYIQHEMDLVQNTFVRNYKMMRERTHHRVSDLVKPD